MLKQVLKNLVDEKKRENVPNSVIRNFLKEYLQYPVLNFIFNSKKYNGLIFTGGSCLRVCFNAPRLSEDLDFDLRKTYFKKFDIEELAESIREYFNNKYLLEIKTKCQSDKRIYLKFSILYDLGIAKYPESNFLYVKIEPSISVFKKPVVENTPISNYGYNFISRNYSLEYLMAGKLNAIFSREWFKGRKNEINIKGRDFYDIFWYFQNKVRPNFSSLRELTGIEDLKQLKKELWNRINKDVTPQKLAYDLKNFFPDQYFVSGFCRNYKDIMKKLLANN